MKLALFIYLANLSDKVSFIFSFGAIVLLFVVVVFALVFPMLFEDFFKLKEHKKYGYNDADDINSYNENILKNRNAAKKYTTLTIVLCLSFSIISALIPSERTLYIMAGAYAAEQIAKSDKAQKIGSDVIDVIEKKLEKMKND